FLDPPPSQFSALSLHDALPIWLFAPVSPAEPMIMGTPSFRAARSILSRSCRCHSLGAVDVSEPRGPGPMSSEPESARMKSGLVADRKSTRLNSSHVKISYAVFC